MKKELEEMTGSIKKEDHEGGDHEASSSSGIDRTSKEPSHPKITKPCDNCHGTYCDMCNCTKCKDATCESCLIASEEYRLRRERPYTAKSAPPAMSPQGIKDVAKMKKDNQKIKEENREGRRRQQRRKEERMPNNPDADAVTNVHMER